MILDCSAITNIESTALWTDAAVAEVLKAPGFPACLSALDSDAFKAFERQGTSARVITPLQSSKRLRAGLGQPCPLGADGTRAACRIQRVRTIVPGLLSKQIAL